MKKSISFFFLCMAALLLVKPSFAELDLDKPVISIPETHNFKPYIWHVQRNPGDCALKLDHSAAVAGSATHFSLELRPRSNEQISNIHVFITDKGLDTYKHLRLSKNENGSFAFDYNAPWRGEYRLEVVFKTAAGWVDISRDIEFSGPDANKHEDQEKDEGYSAKADFYPKDIYAEHVGTILFKLSYKGEPLTGLEEIDGSDIEVASWDENFREFLFVTSQQNTGGPEVPVSIVFRKPGIHAVFAEFKHNGKIRRIDLVIRALEELPPVKLPGLSD